MKPPKVREQGDVSGVQAAIERFLGAAARPAILEPGEELIELTRDNSLLEIRGGRLLLQAWDEKRNLVRRVTGIHHDERARLELSVERFGRKEGRLILLDLARPANHDWKRRGARLILREQFRRMLQREFGGWKLAEISADPDLEHSLSPAYPRALLVHGSIGWAAIAAPPGSADPGVLSFGLIWLDYLRRREKKRVIEGLAVFAPQPESMAWRLRWLNGEAAQFRLFKYLENGRAERVDPDDCGNVDTFLDACRRPICDSPLAARLLAAGDVDCVLRSDGETSFRVLGLEVARSRGGELLFGLGDQRPVSSHNVEEACRLVREVAGLRHGDGPLSRLSPELWLEGQVRRELQRIDPSLRTEPVYGQVPAFTAGERGVIDLLAADRAGRLAVIELKATADLHLPLQALDYWMRVKWHAERSEFSARGYFPGIELQPEAPRLLLISPALEFHPTTETILGYLSPRIHVERIGLGLEWRRRVQVLFHAHSAASV